jgi:hypothetical protein
MSTAQEILARNRIDYIASRKGKFTTKCPTCSGGYLNVEEKSDGVVWYCPNCEASGGGKFDESRFTPGGDLGPIKAVFDYTDESGNRLFQVLKYEPLSAPKTFRQRIGSGAGQLEHQRRPPRALSLARANSRHRGRARHLFGRRRERRKHVAPITCQPQRIPWALRRKRSRPKGAAG